MRKVQRLESASWVDVEPYQVKPGNVIRLFEPDGRPVRHPRLARGGPVSFEGE